MGRRWAGSPAEQTGIQWSWRSELSSWKHGGNTVWWERNNVLSFPGLPCLPPHQTPIGQESYKEWLTYTGWRYVPRFSHVISVCFLYLVYRIRAHKITVSQKDTCKIVSIYFKDRHGPWPISAVNRCVAIGLKCGEEFDLGMVSGFVHI